MGEVAVGDARDQRAEPDPLGHAGEVAERRVALEHVLPLAPDLRDLEEVVHQPEAREARLLGRARDLGERLRRRAVPQPKRETWSPNSSGSGSAALARRRLRRGEERGRHELDRARAVHAREPLAGERLARRRRPRAAAPRRPSPAPASRARGCARARPSPACRRPRRRRARPPRSASARQAARRFGSSPVVSTTVVRPRRSRLRDDQVEHLERVAARALVALARPDHRPQAIRGHDLVGVEPRPRPRRLARPGRPDEHDEAGVGQPQRSLVDHDVRRRPQAQHLARAS